MNLQSTFLFLLTQVCEQDNFEKHNSLKLSFTNIQGFSSNFA